MTVHRNLPRGHLKQIIPIHFGSKREIRNNTFTKGTKHDFLRGGRQCWNYYYFVGVLVLMVAGLKELVTFSNWCIVNYLFTEEKAKLAQYSSLG